MNYLLLWIMGSLLIGSVGYQATLGSTHGWITMILLFVFLSLPTAARFPPPPHDLTTIPRWRRLRTSTRLCLAFLVLSLMALAWYVRHGASPEWKIRYLPPIIFTVGMDCAFLTLAPQLALRKFRSWNTRTFYLVLLIYSLTQCTAMFFAWRADYTASLTTMAGLLLLFLFRDTWNPRPSRFQQPST